MGVFIKGLFIEQVLYTDSETGKINVCVYVACGRASYAVYLDSDCDVELLKDVEQGTKIALKARPYVNKNNRIAWTGGEVVSIG